MWTMLISPALITATCAFPEPINNRFKYWQSGCREISR